MATIPTITPRVQVGGISPAFGRAPAQLHDAAQAFARQGQQAASVLRQVEERARQIADNDVLRSALTSYTEQRNEIFRSAYQTRGEAAIGADIASKSYAQLKELSSGFGSKMSPDQRRAWENEIARSQVRDQMKLLRYEQEQHTIGRTQVASRMMDEGAEELILSGDDLDEFVADRAKWEQRIVGAFEDLGMVPDDVDERIRQWRDGVTSQSIDNMIGNKQYAAAGMLLGAITDDETGEPLKDGDGIPMIGATNLAKLKATLADADVSEFSELYVQSAFSGTDVAFDEDIRLSEAALREQVNDDVVAGKITVRQADNIRTRMNNQLNARKHAFTGKISEWLTDDMDLVVSAGPQNAADVQSAVPPAHWREYSIDQKAALFRAAANIADSPQDAPSVHPKFTDNAEYHRRWFSLSDDEKLLVNPRELIAYLDREEYQIFLRKWDDMRNKAIDERNPRLSFDKNFKAAVSMLEDTRSEVDDEEKARLESDVFAAFISADSKDQMSQEEMVDFIRKSITKQHVDTFFGPGGNKSPRNIDLANRIGRDPSEAQSLSPANRARLLTTGAIAPDDRTATVSYILHEKVMREALEAQREGRKPQSFNTKDFSEDEILGHYSRWERGDHPKMQQWFETGKIDDNLQKPIFEGDPVVPGIPVFDNVSISSELFRQIEDLLTRSWRSDPKNNPVPTPTLINTFYLQQLTRDMWETSAAGGLPPFDTTVQGLSAFVPRDQAIFLTESQQAQSEGTTRANP